MSALFSFCIEKFEARVRSGGTETRYHTHSLVIPFSAVAGTPDADRALSFDFGNYYDFADFIFNTNGLATDRRTSYVSKYLGVSSAISVLLDDDATEAITALHAVTQRKLVDSPFFFSLYPERTDPRLLMEDQRIIANCQTFGTWLLMMAGVSQTLAGIDLHNHNEPSHMFNQVTRRTDGEASVTLVDNGTPYILHDLPDRPAARDFVRIAGQTAMDLKDRGLPLWDKPQPADIIPPALRDWLSHHRL